MSAGPSAEEHVFLIPRPSLKDYVSYMTTEPLDAARADRKQLADEWRAAAAHFHRLQETEAGWVHDPPLPALPAPLGPLVARVLADPIFQRSFAAVPIAFGLVELDRLVVYQKSINLTHVRRLQAQLGPHPSEEAVFRFCLPYDHPTVPVRTGKVARGSYVFVSESNDLRFLEPALLAGGQLRDYQAPGPVAGVLGLVIGYGSNYLNAIYTSGRLILNNGYHRAYALRDLGLQQAPCVIQQVTSDEDFEMVGGGDLRRNPDHYLARDRPLVLKDYFDPQLRKRIYLAPRVRYVRVNYTIEEIDLPRE